MKLARHVLHQQDLIMKAAVLDFLMKIELHVSSEAMTHFLRIGASSSAVVKLQTISSLQKIAA